MSRLLSLLLCLALFGHSRQKEDEADDSQKAHIHIATKAGTTPSDDLLKGGAAPNAGAPPKAAAAASPNAVAAAPPNAGAGAPPNVGTIPNAGAPPKAGSPPNTGAGAPLGGPPHADAPPRAPNAGAPPSAPNAGAPPSAPNAGAPPNAPNPGTAPNTPKAGAPPNAGGPAPPKTDAKSPKTHAVAGNEKSDEEADNAIHEADSQADGEDENGEEVTDQSIDQAQDAEGDDANGGDEDDNAPGQKEGMLNDLGKSLDSPHDKTINVSKEESENSHFFAYLVTTAILVAGLYIAYHNKRKIIAYVLEGRRGKGGRRPNSGDYQRLDHKI